MNTPIDRRQFLTLAALGVVNRALAQNSSQSTLLTAGEVVERIKQNLGVPWRGGPTDTFKAGDENSPVTGIATTVMSTFDVLQRAAASGKNMVITHEPTFWTGNDDVRNFVDDPLYQQKLQFIRDNRMVIWRFHDHEHMKQPDMMATGLAESLGWSQRQSKEDPQVYVLPTLRLRDMAADVEQRLNLKAIRVIGDPDARVSRAALLFGAPPFHAATILPKVDVVIAGEQREWEGVEYVADANTAGDPKGMIIIGHWVSEDQGMRVCASWLKTFVSEVPVEWISAGDPFWRP